MSDDGSKIVYASAADNLVDGDTNGRVDVFLTTINPGKPNTPPSAGSGGSPSDPGVAPSVASTVRISVGRGGAQGNGDSLGASISPDGHWIAFESSASNLADDPNGPVTDVFTYHVDDGSLRPAAAGATATASLPRWPTPAPCRSLDGRQHGPGAAAAGYVRTDKTESSPLGLRRRGDGKSGESWIAATARRSSSRPTPTWPAERPTARTSSSASSAPAPAPPPSRAGPRPISRRSPPTGPG